MSEDEAQVLQTILQEILQALKNHQGNLATAKVKEALGFVESRKGG